MSRRAPSRTEIAFGKKLREARLAVGLTVRQLASRAGVSPGFVSLLESGQRRPAPDALDRIAAALLLDPENLKRTRAKEKAQTARKALSRSARILQSALWRVSGQPSLLLSREVSDTAAGIDVVSDVAPFERIDSLRLPRSHIAAIPGAAFAIHLSRSMRVLTESLSPGDLVICARQPTAENPVAFVTGASTLELVRVVNRRHQWRPIGMKGEIREDHLILGTPVAVLKSLRSL